MRQVELEDWQLANLHVLRCLDQREDMSKLEQMFVYRCWWVCSEISSFDIELRLHHRPCQRNWAGRENEAAYTAKRIVIANSMINEVAKMIEINALNMVALHFRRRLLQSIRFRFTPQKRLKLKTEVTDLLLGRCYRVKTV